MANKKELIYNENRFSIDYTGVVTYNNSLKVRITCKNADCILEAGELLIKHGDTIQCPVCKKTYNLEVKAMEA